MDIAGFVGAFWFLGWVIPVVVLHFRLVGKLEELGVEVPWRLQARAPRRRWDASRNQSSSGSQLPSTHQKQWVSHSAW